MLNQIFKRDAENVPTIKLVIYGPSLAGKTTLLSIYSTLKKVESPDQIYSDLKKIEADGRTVLFDQSVFELPRSQSSSLPMLRYALYSVAGQERFRDTRKVVLRGVDGLMIMLDPHKDQFEFNKSSLEELVTLEGDAMKSGDLPWILVINKMDLSEDIRTPTNDILTMMVDVGLVPNIGEAFSRLHEISCLQAKKDLIELPKRSDWAQLKDASGRLRRDARPESVVRAAAPIENLTRQVVEHKIRKIREARSK